MEKHQYSVGILVVSDSCSSGQAVDSSGINLKETIESDKLYSVSAYAIVPDDINAIKEKLIEWSDTLKLNLILTTGGSGLSPRDVTPEATKEVIDKEANSLTTAILVQSLKITQFAMLSRAVSGIRKSTLIINLPGSKKGSQESLSIVLPVLKHALDLLVDCNSIDVKKDHAKIQAENENKHICSHQSHNGHKSRVTAADIANKPRNSEYPMLSMDKANALLMHHTFLQDTERVHFLDADKRVCAQEVKAQEPMPPFAASIKDGFAVRFNAEQIELIKAINEGRKSSNLTEGVLFVFEVVGAANAGDELINFHLNEGQCVKINTGAPVPLKSDAVIQIEDTVSLAKDANGIDTQIEVLTRTIGSIKLGQDIRPIGFDIKPGECVIRKNTIISAPQIGICATVGALELEVYKVPTVALISTGNELVGPDKVSLKGGQIRDSNKALLYSALKSFGILNVIDAGVAKDEPNSVLEVFRNGAEKADVIISTGGVSMGDKDLVKDVLLKDLNCQIHFARLNMKPGKPTTFATCHYNGKQKLFFCLPGNPVSAIVTFNLIVLPSLKKMMGYTKTSHTEIKVICQFDSDLDPRPEYHRGIITWPHLDNSETPGHGFPSVQSTGNQHSSRLMSMNAANCLVKLPGRTEDKKTVSCGEILSALIIEKI